MVSFALVMKDVAAMAGYIITLITLFTLICKPIRERVIEKITQVNQNQELCESIKELKEQVEGLQKSLERLEQQREKDTEAMKCSLRNTITHLYYKYMRIGEIPPLERENISMLYKSYESLNGNSYVHTCYEELMDLPTTNL